MNRNSTENRKKDHIELCLTGDVSFKTKTNGFENYEFEHYAVTQIDYNSIDLSTTFLRKRIGLPFIISCMTGGTGEAEKINENLAVAAKELNIPIGVGSQRQALENKKFHSTYKVVRKNAGNVPVLGNIGAAQIAKSKNPVDEILFLAELVEADAMVIHFNPLQELLQKEGEPDFSGSLKNLEKICRRIEIPVIAKEVGSGIGKKAAKDLLNAGIQGIDVAGSGGTSWAIVEQLRNKEDLNYFSEWGLPTSYCIKTISGLKKNYKFSLIASGGINDGIAVAKSIALGADYAASARLILQEVINNGVDGAAKLVNQWFDTVKKIMYLTGSSNIKELQKVKLIPKSELF
ncbi:MAG: type 2 isopentenyl-diphosphate Delta-isomerase [Bacteroidota bacterium]